MTEVIEQSKGVAVQEQGGGFLQIIAANPNMTPEAVNSLLDAKERWEKMNAEKAFNEAMARLQPRLPEIKKASKAHNSKYAKFEHIERMVRPFYTNEGFSIRYNSELVEAGEKYIGTLMHKDGYSVTASIILPPDGSGSKNAIQAKGSTVSYARRYLLCMLLNIVTADEDDDGNAAGGVITEEQAAKLKDLLKETGSDTKKFLELFGAASVDELPAKEFRKANALLLAKRDTVKGGENA